MGGYGGNGIAVSCPRAPLKPGQRLDRLTFHWHVLQPPPVKYEAWHLNLRWKVPLPNSSPAPCFFSFYQQNQQSIRLSTQPSTTQFRYVKFTHTNDSQLPQINPVFLNRRVYVNYPKPQNLW
jgi:hypothetical protein